MFGGKSPPSTVRGRRMEGRRCFFFIFVGLASGPFFLIYSSAGNMEEQFFQQMCRLQNQYVIWVCHHHHFVIGKNKTLEIY
jgi:hypothetical protein